jgi:peptide subunit release factor 1 (eRF1)
MITRRELEELVATDTHGQPVLSVCLTTDLTKHLKEERRLALRQMLEPFGDAAKEDVARVQDYVDREFDWQSRSIVLFSSAPAGFWQQFRLAVPVRDEASLEPQPNIRVLTQVMDEYECLAVALVNREHARFFAISLGEITEFSQDLPPTPARQKQGGWSAERYQRHVDALALQNLKQAAQRVDEFCKSQECGKLLLAGTEETTAQFRPLLPKPLQKRIIGEFPMDIHAPASLVLERAREIQEYVEREQELAEVTSLCAAAQQKNPTATLGLPNTLNALMQGQVSRLVAAAHYSARGTACEHCGFLSTQSLTTCPLCSSEMHHVDGMVDLAVHKAVESGSEVEIVRGAAAAKLNEMGAIGARLRF